ncbi:MULTISPECIES: glycosyltransferase [Streptomyces]|uniref:Glycosyltransferase n=1 Tax=Streptomyces rhizosphaericola TaxID=2564098 RepID=A0ABY2PLN8_9ACTN|nr:MULTISPECIES: glycosyltransferase [Streptomyces]MYT97792.1 glycosyltransferase [Streptomyces sp. SID8350]TGZ11980.1 glycosyltransferase [Streptomyces rhizosphaericola]SCK17399.1 Glycosyltransferase involved in cell wall bisynthesis [Streptomyces sp. AmelKG-D3]
MTGLQLSVVVPCFNEAEVLGTFHNALLTVLEELATPFEICYVDDGSGDATRELLAGLALRDERVHYTAFSRNFGKEAAMLAGLRMSRAAAVVIMDADLQHPPELIPRMLELHRHGYDQVIPRRDRAGEGVVRSTLSHTYYALVRRCMDVELIDGSGDFRLLSRRAVESVLSLPESNRFSKGIFSWIGFDTVTFRYRNSERAAGRSKWGSRRLLNYGIDGLLSFNNRPLRLAIYTGFWVLFSALAYALWTVITVVLHGADTPGYATLLTAVVALSGIQLVTLGVIGEYVGRIYHEAKHRPPYVVRETDATRRTLRERRLPTGSLVIGEPAGSAAWPSSAAGPSSLSGASPVPGASSVPGVSSARSRTARQFGSFVLIGCLNTAVYLGVYAALNRWIPYLVAHAIGYAVSIVCSFLLNSHVTCRTKPTWRAFVRYPLSGLVNLVASGALLYGAVTVLGMDENLAALAAGVMVTPLSFLLARWAIMSGRRPRTSGASEVSVPEEAPQPQPAPAVVDSPAADRPMAGHLLAPRSGGKG